MLFERLKNRCASDIGYLEKESEGALSRMLSIPEQIARRDQLVDRLVRGRIEMPKLISSWRAGAKKEADTFIPGPEFNGLAFTEIPNKHGLLREILEAGSLRETPMGPSGQYGAGVYTGVHRPWPGYFASDASEGFVLPLAGSKMKLRDVGNIYDGSLPETTLGRLRAHPLRSGVDSVVINTPARINTPEFPHLERLIDDRGVGVVDSLVLQNALRRYPYETVKRVTGRYPSDAQIESLNKDKKIHEYFGKPFRFREFLDEDELAEELRNRFQ